MDETKIYSSNNQDIDSVETEEWLAALRYIIKHEGMKRAQFLIEKIRQEVGADGCPVCKALITPYVNTIPAKNDLPYPGNDEIENRIRAILRWNAALMVLRATDKATELGGHIATYTSAAELYEVGFNHCFRAANEEKAGDLIFIQGHSAPGIYARAFLEGRLTEEQIGYFRQEVDGRGISSYPHPWLMRDFWQFPTVSMGLGPLQSIYQARFLKYLENRKLLETKGRKVWAFCGDGEMDEPESQGALTVATREGLENLIFVINCNLQRLDGPVYGNGNIANELEGLFNGAGWKVFKVLWGRGWDALFAKDQYGFLQKRMDEVVDGEYQTYRSKDGAYIREHFFGKYPELKALVADMSDEQIWALTRGGHDTHKIYTAFRAAMDHVGSPVVILAQTVKGYGMGGAGEAMMVAHSQKKMSYEDLKAYRDRFLIPVTDDEIKNHVFYKPDEDGAEIKYIRSHRESLGGYLPLRRKSSEMLKTPPLETFKALLEGSGDREHSTTMTFSRFVSHLLKDKTLGKRVVPIIPDESRTFGMEGMFRQYGIYSPVGQLYEPEDKGQVMSYREAKDGQLLEEGITEPGAMASWIAAATSYSTNNYPMIPFYIFYSMFGFQRTADLAWAAGDIQARGFLMGATSGRTTLAGEGLQHQDGHGQLFASVIPNCVSYDPTYSYELTVIMHNGLHRMFEKQENVFFYITVMNENYHHPEMPEGVEEGILRGLYLFKKSQSKSTRQVQLMGSGAILREVEAAAQMLENEFDVAANVWSATSLNELHRDGVATERWNLLHPGKSKKKTYVEACMQSHRGPIVAATDYIRTYADQIRPYVKQPFYSLGTDGFGRSDTREKLREFFEVNRYYIVVAALYALAEAGEMSVSDVEKAIKKYNIDPEKPNPVTV